MLRYELRDPDDARLFLFQGLWLQRVTTTPPPGSSLRPALEWALEIASRGDPLPPVGFVADLGNVALGMDWEARAGHRRLELPHTVPTHLLPTYEDHVLGRIYADWNFSQGCDALRQYREGRDRARGLAFILACLREKAGFGGVELAPGVIAAALELTPEEILRLGFDSLERDGLMEELVNLYEELIKQVRVLNEALDKEDVYQLQQRTALDDESDRLALTQTLRAKKLMESSLPRHRVRPLAHRQEVPTRVLDEDTYPVGGFSSISNRGSVESLLHSQLAYMDSADERPDLFDIKFLRDELLYYSRDENQFLRRRRTFVFALFEDLAQTIRYKDAELTYQRGILLLALCDVIVRKLCEWLSTDSLVFEFVFPVEARHPFEIQLLPEFELLLKLLREQVNNRTVVFQFLVESKGLTGPLQDDIARVRAEIEEKVGQGSVTFDFDPKPIEALGRYCTRKARRSLCQCLLISSEPRTLEAEDTVITAMQVNRAYPLLGEAGKKLLRPEAEDATDCWNLALQEMLQRWI